MFSRVLLRVVFGSLFSSGFLFHLVLCSITFTLSRLKSFTVGRQWGTGVEVAFCRSMAVLIRNVLAGEANESTEYMLHLNTSLSSFALSHVLMQYYLNRLWKTESGDKWCERVPRMLKDKECIFLLFSFFWNESWVGNPATLVSNLRPDRIAGI